MLLVHHLLSPNSDVTNKNNNQNKNKHLKKTPINDAEFWI